MAKIFELCSKDDLDSQDIDRVMSAVKQLLRVCNHADFRHVTRDHGQVTFDQIELEKYPKLIQSAVVELQTDWFCHASRSISEGLSWVVEQQNAICEEKYLNSVQKTQNLLIAMPNFTQNQGKHIKTEPDTTPKILKIQASSDTPGKDVVPADTCATSPQFETDHGTIENPQSSAEKVILNEMGFSGTIYSNTVRSLTLKFNQQKAARNGSIAFFDRIAVTNRNRFPWASCPTLTRISSAVAESDEIKQKIKSEKIFTMCPKVYIRGAPGGFWPSLAEGKSRAYSCKLEQMRKELNLPTHFRAKHDPLRIMVCVRSDESGELIRSYLIRSLGIESVFIHSNLSEIDKKVFIHEFNFSLSTCALIFNTRAGALPLPPSKIDKGPFLIFGKI